MSEWADKHRHLTAVSSAEPGRWRTSRTPYLRDVMDAFTDPNVFRIVLQFCAQVGKTEALLNAMGYMMQHAPKPVLVVQPTIEEAKKFSKARVATMLQASPSLRQLVDSASPGVGTNTIAEKLFQNGGRLVFVGSNSPNGLSGQPISVVLCDEIDKYVISAGVEGDPIDLAEARTRTFANAKVMLTSTPTLKNASRVEKAYLASDQRIYKVPCPHCDYAAELRWKNVRWEKDDEGEGLPETAQYFCENCGSAWTEGERREAVRKGHWEATKPFKDTAGFRLNVLAAPWANVSLEGLVTTWLAATKPQINPARLQAFLNLSMAETWDDPSEGTDALGIMHRREVYPVDEDGGLLIPRGVALLCCGVDVQIDRVEATVLGFGRGMETWVLEHEIIYGDPTGRELWGKLGKFLIKPRKMERGGWDFIRHTSIDSGYQMDAVVEFCRKRFRMETPDGRFAFTTPVKGIVGTRTHTWPQNATKTKHGNAKIYLVAVDVAKTAIYGAINQIREAGPGYWHFPKYFKKPYFDQFTSERRVQTTNQTGHPVYTWKLIEEGRRNEALDCSVYAYAACAALRFWGVDLDKEADRVERIAEMNTKPSDSAPGWEPPDSESTLPSEPDESGDPNKGELSMPDPTKQESKLPYATPPKPGHRRRRRRISSDYIRGR